MYLTGQYLKLRCFFFVTDRGLDPEIVIAGTDIEKRGKIETEKEKRTGIETGTVTGHEETDHAHPMTRGRGTPNINSFQSFTRFMASILLFKKC